jgi:hypothetical protein
MSSAGLNSVARRAPKSTQKKGFRTDFLRVCTDFLRRLPPNLAHKTAVKALRYGLLSPPPAFDDDVLQTSLWGIDFANPIGMAAGFDKNAEAANGLLGLGFGFVEVGTVTPDPQGAIHGPICSVSKTIRRLSTGWVFRAMGWSCLLKIWPVRKAAIPG